MADTSAERSYLTWIFYSGEGLGLCLGEWWNGKYLCKDG